MRNKWWFIVFGIAGVLLAISLVFRLVERNYLYAFLDFVLMVLSLIAALWSYHKVE